jgi:hypothetical protein
MTQPSFVRRRPTAVLVLAILHLVFGSLGLVMLLCSGAIQAVQSTGGFGGPGQAEAQQLQKRIEDIPGQKAYTMAEMGVDLVLDVMLLTAGIGLLGMKAWARILSLVYAVLSILNRVGTLVFTLAVLLPALDTVLAEETMREPKLQGVLPVMKMGMIIGAVFSALVVIYPIVVLILLNLRSVKAAFHGEAPPPPAPLPEDEGWGAMRPPGASTDVTTRPEPTDPDRERFQPPT